MKKYFSILLVLTLVIGLTAAAAGAEKIFKVGIGEDPTTLNPWAAYGAGDSSMYNFVVTEGYLNSLLELAAPTYDTVPGLAAEMPPEFEKEGDYYTSVVDLRQGLKWSDGNEFTAGDVAFTYNTIIDFKLEGNWANYHPENLVKVEAVDRYRAKFFFTSEPGLAEWIYGTLQGPIVSRANWIDEVEKAREAEDSKQALFSVEVTDPVTIDGMDLDNWQKGAFFQNVPAEHYQGGGVTRFYNNGRVELEEEDWSWAGYGEEGSELDLKVEHGPFIDSAVYRLYTNQDAMVMALKKGDVDYMLSAQGLTKGFRQELEAAEAVDVVSNPPNGWRYLAFNRDRYPFSIDEFNQAIATLIDREYVTERVLQGACEPSSRFVPPANTFWHNPDVEPLGAGLSRPERVARAVELLEEAGFSWETKPEVDLENNSYTAGSGIIMPNGEKMEPFDILTPPAGYDPMRATFGLWIQNWMQDLGIPGRARPTQFNVILDRCFNSDDFDAFILGWGLGGVFPDFMHTFFHSEGGFNNLGYSDPVLDKILEEFMKATDMDVARDLAFKAQEQLQESLPYIVLFYTPIYDAYRTDHIEFPFTEVLDGIQGFYGVPTEVKVLN